MIQLLYFAGLRDTLGTEGEQISPSGDVRDIAGLKTLLVQRGGAWSEIFAGDQPVLAAVNHEMAQDDTPIKDTDEVGFFPPVTGG